MSQQNKTIELRTYTPDKQNELSSKRATVILKKNLEIKAKRDRLRLQREYRKLNTITNLKSLMNFVLKCLVVNVILILFYSYNMIQATTTIDTVSISFVYISKYLLSVLNSVFYLKILLDYGDLKKEIKKKKEAEAEFKIEDFHVKENLEFVLINKPIQGVRRIIIFCLFSWHIKYFLYIIMVGIESNISYLEYIDILFMMIDYYFYHLLKFYYFCMLRIEFMSQKYGKQIY